MKVRIEERDFDLEASLSPLSELDVIFGMDWLSEQRARIDCSWKEVLFEKCTIRETTFSGFHGVGKTLMSALQVVKDVRKVAELCFVLLSASEGKPRVSDVRVVSEFPDVFPEVLPGAPPQCEIDFCFDVVTGVKPVSRAS